MAANSQGGRISRFVTTQKVDVWYKEKTQCNAELVNWDTHTLVKRA